MRCLLLWATDSPATHSDTPEPPAQLHSECALKPPHHPSHCSLRTNKLTQVKKDCSRVHGGGS